MQFFSFANEVLPYLDQLYSYKKIADLNRYADVLAKFRRQFGYGSALLCSSPGRVELIGNHLDHNGGKVLACTVNIDIIAAFRANSADVIRIAAKNRQTIRISVNDDAPCERSAGLVKGMVKYLRKQGFRVGGFDAYTDSVIPTGAGVSSSAAFELLVGRIISALFNDDCIPEDILARAGQFAENVYFGKPCGLLDQSVIAIGGTVRLDFSDGLRYEKLQTDLYGASLVLINTGKSHSQLSDLYAAIPADMQAVAGYFGKKRLIEVDPIEFFERYEEAAHAVGVRQTLRAKHFFDELSRVEQMSELLIGQADRGAHCTPKLSDKSQTYLSDVISLINASGESSLTQLKNCAVDEHDTAIADIIDFAHSVCPCGARVHGGGFAGTVLCVVPHACLTSFLSAATAKYGVDKVYSLKPRSVGTTIL